MGSPFSQNELHISVSQVKTFLRCPRAFEFRYVQGATPEFLPVPFAFGTAFHSALAFFYGALKDNKPEPPLEELHQHFADSWSVATSGPVPLQAEADGGNQDELLAKAGQMLSTFRDHALSNPVAEVVSIEQPFEVELHHPDTGELLDERLIGVIDLVLGEAEHRTIIEHKTSSKKYTADQLRFDIQPSAYAYAADHLGWGDVGLRYQVVTKVKHPAVQVEDLRRDPTDIDDFLRTVLGVLRSVDAGVSFPVRGWQCRSCQFQRRCTQ